MCIAIGLGACDSATTPTGRLEDGPSAAMQQGNGVTRSATGEGTSELPAGFGPASYRFNALEKADGSVKGTFSVFRIRNGLTSDFEGEVTCVGSDPLTNRMWIGGRVTINRSTDPNQQLAIHQPGRDTWFRMVDNGEGANAVADRLTVLGFEGGGGILTSAQYCLTRPWAANDANTFPLIEGNLQTRP
jgi:hypothetical protein